ncbi:Hypothetical protein FKW44_014288, partial [Caligus rogercresseyi]
SRQGSRHPQTRRSPDIAAARKAPKRKKRKKKNVKSPRRTNARRSARAPGVGRLLPMKRMRISFSSK